MTDTARERERRKQAIFTLPNKYGYQLNVNNPTINRFYEDYIRRAGIFRPPSDKERFAFEEALWGFFKRVYKKMYPENKIDIPPLPKERHIGELFFGWRLETLEIYINFQVMQDINKAIELFRRVKIDGRIYS